MMSRKQLYQRRERDSNPRELLHPNGFRDRRIQPLCHLSNSYLFVIFYFVDLRNQIFCEHEYYNLLNANQVI